jgi:hypothetical protein
MVSAMHMALRDRLFGCLGRGLEEGSSSSLGASMFTLVIHERPVISPLPLNENTLHKHVVGPNFPRTRPDGGDTRAGNLRTNPG